MSKDSTPPETCKLPTYMLKAHDMVFHPVHRWFYPCNHNGTYPTDSSILDEEKNVLVALDAEAALRWNEAQRAERLAQGS